jgi:hypothetical protein
MIDAVVRALETTLDDVYTRDKKRILRRARLVLSEPSLQAASEVDRAALRAALAPLLGTGLDAAVAAAAIVATLETAVRHWVEGHGKTSFRSVLRAAFRGLRRVVTRG